MLVALIRLSGFIPMEDVIAPMFPFWNRIRSTFSRHIKILTELIARMRVKFHFRGQAKVFDLKHLLCKKPENGKSDSDNVRIENQTTQQRGKDVSCVFCRNIGRSNIARAEQNEEALTRISSSNRYILSCGHYACYYCLKRASLRFKTLTCPGCGKIIESSRPG